MGLPFLITIVVVVSALLCIPLLASALIFLLCGGRYRLPLFGGRRSADDLEKGKDEAPVRPETEPACLAEEKKDMAVLRKFRWPEVKSLTGNFAAEAVVGEGGSNTVYLAGLPSSGNGEDESLAAVKLHRPSERLHRAFRQELDVLSRLSHPHVVRLLGYCDDLEEGVLLFEYSPNGNLHERLHGAGETLSWAQRMAIAHKIALALEYLHEGCDPQIVHCDVKASNVLLDDSFQPKLCDFGSAQVGFSAAIQPPSSSGRSADRQMMGSPGYVDPYYLMSGMTSKKNDVYSFGVLLMELLTGQEAFDPEREPQMLVAAIRPMLKSDGGDDPTRHWLEAVVDKRLVGEFDAGEAAVVAEIAAMCVVENPGLRPSMTQVARIFGEKMSSSILPVNSESDDAPKL